MLLGACSGKGDAVSKAPPPPTTTAGIGFFTPEGIRAELVHLTQFGMLNAANPEQVAASLALANGTAFKVNIDLGPVIAQPMALASIKTAYHDRAGNLFRKEFAPLAQTKLRQFPADEQLRAMLAPYFDVLKQHAANVSTIFLADEPYLNGIPKAELERAAALARKELDARGLQSVKLGVIFASGMFDSRFAAMIDGEAGEFARGIDKYYRSGDATPEWVSIIQSARLTTYDGAGNMYTGGGIPEGFDVIGFDFYLSTILLDGLHQNTLSWFAANHPNAGCSQFAGKTMSQIRGKLSFFDNNSMKPGTQAADRTLLDAVYQCRMQATTSMLEKSLAGHKVELLMISESSNNGVLEFTKDGTPKQGQPSALVEARVFDEVRRAESFFATHGQSYRAGLMFFTYQNTYDKTINLNIGGASGMPSVMDSIAKYSAGAAPK